MGESSPKLLFEIKIYDDGTMTINDKPFSEFIKSKVTEELAQAVGTAELDESMGNLAAPDTGEDINVFWCNNCPR